MKNSIFISYRRQDTENDIGRIHDYLVKHFGQDAVFKDDQSTPLGWEYPLRIKEALDACRVMLVLIGPEWLTAKDEHGNRRLNQEGDWVRREIETGLNKDIPVIPLRVRGARPLVESELPESIKELMNRQGPSEEIRFKYPDFEKDMSWLVDEIKKSMGELETLTRDESTQQVVLEDLTSEQREKLTKALIAAFPNMPDLELMVKRQLNERLNLITQGEPNYVITVDKLVEWAEAKGKIQELVDGARKENPGNPKLKKLANLWLKM